MTTACFMLTTLLLGNIIIGKILINFINKTTNCSLSDTYSILSGILEVSHSFVQLADSKFIGLAIFLISNLFTGLVNFTLNTHAASYNMTIFILSLNLFVSSLIPFSIYYFKNRI